MKFAIPRLLGFILDSIYQFGWRYYVRDISNRGVYSLECGHCKFYFDKNDFEVVEASLNRLNTLNPSVVKFLEQSRDLSFVLAGTFPSYTREANLKILIKRNTVEHGVDGVISIIGYGYVLETERRKRGTIAFRLFPPSNETIKELWITWLEKSNIDSRIIDFYKSNSL